MQSGGGGDRSSQNESAAIDERIEYDDAAIFAFHPHLRRRLNFDTKVNETQDPGEERKRDIKHEDVQVTSKQIVPSPEEIASKMLKGAHEKLAKVKEDINSCTADMKAIKTNFENMNRSVDGVEISNRGVKKLAKRFVDELEVVIHQNTIINHLAQVAKEMELFECYITEDRHVIFIDNDDVLVEECTAHDGSDNNSCCACQYKSKMDVYDDVD